MPQPIRETLEISLEFPPTTRLVFGSSGQRGLTPVPAGQTVPQCGGADLFTGFFTLTGFSLPSH